MPRRKTAMEQLLQIDLAAVERDEREILIMNMNPVFFIRFAELIGQHIIIHKMLGTFCPELQHDPHRCICIDIGIITLQVNIDRIRKEDILIGFHQMLLSRPTLRMLLTIRDVLLGHVIEIILHELLLDDVLDFLNADILTVLDIPLDLAGHFVDILVRHPAATIHIGPGNRIEDLLAVISHGMARTLCHCL